MYLNQLPKIVTKSKKRIGRGIGSGKGGHTSSRGQKGQKSRNKIHPLFEGTKVKKSLIQRLPLQRGKGKLKSLSLKPAVLNLEDLNKVPVGSVVNTQALISLGLVDKSAVRRGVKILGRGKLKSPLTVNLPVSQSVAQAVEKVGGKVE